METLVANAETDFCVNEIMIGTRCSTYRVILHRVGLASLLLKSTGDDGTARAMCTDNTNDQVKMAILVDPSTRPLNRTTPNKDIRNQKTRQL